MNKAKEPKNGKIYWLIKRTENGYSVVGFMREQHRDGFLIIGGLTGSHFGGHGEGWRTKFGKLISEGYMSELVAKEKKIIPAMWKAPKLSKRDKELIKLSFKVSKIIKTKKL